MLDYNLLVTIAMAGVIIVFAVLIILAVIVFSFNKKMKALDSTFNKKTEKKEANQFSIEKLQQSVITETANAEGIISEEIIAVISAAVASFMDDGKGFVIKGIQKAKENRRPIWSSAGIFDNTRPFSN